MKQLFSSFVLLAVLLPAYAAEKPAARVMTRNLDAGTDLNYIFAATDAASFAKGMAATWAEIQAASIPERAALAADEIASQQPDLVALQEVTLWRKGAILSPPAIEVVFDQLDLLLKELAKRKLVYAVVAAHTQVDAEAPVPTAGIDLRITDRDVILARTDLPPSEFDLNNVHSSRYKAQFVFGSDLLGSIKVPRGWMSVDTTVRGMRFRFVNTHLESGIPGVPAADQAQVKQADELMSVLLNSELPLVLAGDFNANAEPGPEHFDTYQHILSAGFVDAWRETHAGDMGFTWPLFGEDQLSGPAVPNEPIDLIFTRGLNWVGFSRGLPLVKVERIGSTAPYASDHAGVVATFRID